MGEKFGAALLFYLIFLKCIPVLTGNVSYSPTHKNWKKNVFLVFVQLANILHPAEFLEDSVEIVFHNAENIARTSFFLYLSMDIS